MSELLLDIQGLEKSFPGVKALKGVSLQVNKGEIHALMGENGAGKSTLIKVLTGIYQKDAGTICFDGENVNVKSPIEANKKGISTIYQELNLNPFQTVYENLFLGREPRTRFGSIDRKRMIAEAKRILNGLDIHIDVNKPLSHYSTAIQQMVAVARAISTNSRLVIMDEPTSSLDAKEVSVLFEVIRKLKEQGISVIFISHKLDEIFEICERLTVLKDGAYIGAYDVKDLDQFKLITLMVGNETAERKRKRTGYSFKDAKELIRGQNIHKGMRLQGIDIDIKEGEVVGLAGLLGSGRSEIAQVLFGACKPDEGKIFWYGQLSKRHGPADAIKKGIGYCTENRKEEGIIPHLSVKENITIALLPKLSKFGFVNVKEQKRVVQTYIDKLKIKTPSLEQPINHLSGGNQQKVLLARWMCMEPKLIIMDEPTRGIDVGAKAEIEQLIQDFSKIGISVLMISSEIAELVRNCDRILVLRDGKKKGELISQDINEEKIMEIIAQGSEGEGA